MYQSQRFSTVLGKATQAIVLVYQGIAAVTFIASLFQAYNWLKNPFIGGFFEQTMVLNGSDTSEAGKQWAMYEQGFDLGDQLVSVDGTAIHTSKDLQNKLSSHYVNEIVPVEIRTTDGNVQKVDITLQAFQAADQIAYFVMPGFLGLVFLIVSLWIFGLRRSEPAGRAFSMLTASLAIAIGSLFDLYTTHRFTYFWTMAVAVTGGALIDLSLGFPQEARFVIGRPYFRWLGYMVGVALILNAYSTLYDFQNPIAYITAWQTIYGFVGLSALFYFGALAYHAFLSYSPVVKSQARTILIGSLVAFGPMVIWLLYSSLVEVITESPASDGFNPYLFVTMIIFPIVNGYVILRYRLLRTDTWLRQGMVYALLTVFVVAIFGLLVSGIALMLSIPMPSDNPYLIGGLVFVIAILLDPLRNRLQVIVDSAFFRGRRAYEDRLRTFSHELTSARSNTIGRVLRRQISAPRSDRLHIYIMTVERSIFVTCG
jgi:hypothetical protein